MGALQDIIFGVVTRCDLIGIGLVVFAIGLCPGRSPALTADTNLRRGYCIRLTASVFIFLVGVGLSVIGARAWPVEGS